mgnify:CR=1 FL=1|tara:strand:+ start:261 stop:1091 length:831 start_codon:yes stop_codon:yes gene_type:complete
MASNEEFLSRENKELLWNVLYENNAFSSIPHENFNTIQKLFEESLLECNKESSDLMLTNKEFMSEFIAKINKFKNTIILNETKRGDVKERISKTEQYDSLRNNSRKEINNSFVNKKLELTQLLNPPQPKEINFSDTDDEPLDNSKIDDMLKETIRQRELDIGLPSTTSNHMWLSGENASSDSMQKIIKIGEEISSAPAKEITDKPSKKVAWAEDDLLVTEISKDSGLSVATSFFDNLKVKESEPSLKEIMEKLIKLDNKVNKVIELLTLNQSSLTG